MSDTECARQMTAAKSRLLRHCKMQPRLASVPLAETGGRKGKRKTKLFSTLPTAPENPAEPAGFHISTA
jgi:hypothetical protein